MEMTEGVRDEEVENDGVCEWDGSYPSFFRSRRV
jgi:hypothetical protein